MNGPVPRWILLVGTRPTDGVRGLVVLMVVMVLGVRAWAEVPAWAPTEAQPTMAIEEVRVGMKGYGLTVYHGDAIEAFPVVVKSVVFNGDPKRSVIWVDCVDERMQKYGPVQGMSGSPIYLWEEGESGVMGEGGRLIGAFAFGYADTNECLAGVQPIAYMRETGARAGRVADATSPNERGLRTRPGAAVAVLRSFGEAAGGAHGVWQSGMVSASTEIVSRTPWGRGVFGTPPTDGVRGLRERDGGLESMPLSLPVNVGSAGAASAIAPMMVGSGLMPVAGGSFGSMSVEGGMSDGPVPSNVEPSRVKLEPGSVLAVPLAFGDYVPAAAGTVTDVLPDGTVVGFGHAMDGVGDTALPMATGYTHYVVSRRSISFKWTGVLGLAGSLVQDEAAAVAGVPGRAFETSPVTVRVTMPEQATREYNYEVVNHPTYTSSIAVLMPIVSMVAVSNPPQENTTHVTGRFTFSNGRTLPIDLLIPFGSARAFAFEFGPTMTTLLQNEFEKVELVSAEYDIDVQPGVRLTFIESMSVSPSVVKPGDTVTVRIVTRAYDGPAQAHTVQMRVPSDATAGELPIVAAGADDFVNFTVMNDPKFAVIESADELFDVFEQFLTLERDTIHVAMLRPDRGSRSLAVGNASLRNLPSHHAALLQNVGTTAVQPGSPFVPELLQRLPVGRVVTGEQSVVVRVQPAE